MATNEKATIVDLVEGLPRLRVYDEEITTFENKQFVSTITLAEKNTYLGIEVETENVHFWDQNASPYWKIAEDGSLRNNGREFISIPIKAFRVENALTSLFKYQLNKDIDFTERTSIHIHMNVRTMTLEQLKTMILLYIVFEKALFRYVDPERYNNIFCVPLNETLFGEKLHTIFHSDLLSISWLKYTALNLCPIFEKGTIEFRHLHGTKNIPEIMNWINLILSLKKAALKNSSEYLWEKIKTLNTSSEYHSFANEIFGSFVSNLNEKTLAEDMSSCVTYAKAYCFINEWKTLVQQEIEESNPLYAFSAVARSKEILRRHQANQSAPMWPAHFPGETVGVTSEEERSLPTWITSGATPRAIRPQRVVAPPQGATAFVPLQTTAEVMNQIRQRNHMREMEMEQWRQQIETRAIDASMEAQLTQFSRETRDLIAGTNSI